MLWLFFLLYQVECEIELLPAVGCPDLYLAIYQRKRRFARGARRGGALFHCQRALRLSWKGEHNAKDNRKGRRERESFVSPSKPANLLKMNPFISFQASLSVFWMTSVTFPTAGFAKENEC